MTENKKQKLTVEMVKAELEMTADEQKVFDNLMVIGYTPAKLRKAILDGRKKAEKIAEKARKQAEKIEGIAKYASYKLAKAKELYNELSNLPIFAGYEKELLTIENVSNYQNFKGRTWKIYGKLKIEKDWYIVTLEYTKEGLFALPCFINVDDVIFQSSQVKILDYEKDVCLAMTYEKVE